MRIYGVDFTCAPRRAKPITAACADLKNNELRVEQIEKLQTFAEFEALLARPGPWIGGFDFPFSLPRELVRHCAAMPRQDFRQALDAYRNTRPVGRRYAHRATDLPAGSSSPMKLVNPPVALMFHEGAPRILAAGVHVPALFEGDSSRVALEAYPGLLVRKQLGIRDSYKSDTRSERTPARAAARRRIVQALRAGRPLGVKVKATIDLVEDGSGDTLDAVICAVHQPSAAAQPRYGLPVRVPRAEGWIVTA
jgi:hypothetical protein